MPSTPDRKVVDTGSLRGALQPVRFATLSAPFITIYGDVFGAEGDHVAMQYWGGGNIRVTKVDSHLSGVVKAHDLRIYEPKHVELDNHGSEV